MPEKLAKRRKRNHIAVASRNNAKVAGSPSSGVKRVPGIPRFPQDHGAINIVDEFEQQFLRQNPRLKYLFDQRGTIAKNERRRKSTSSHGRMGFIDENANVVLCFSIKNDF